MPRLIRSMEAQQAERLVRGLMRATERSLRSHLGARAQDRSFVGELYLSLRRALSQYDTAGIQQGLETRGMTDELALTAYLVVVSCWSDVPVGPGLLESLRRTIGETLAGWKGTDTVPDP